MKSVCVVVAMAGFALAGVSSAFAASQDIDISANVADVCTIAGTQGAATAVVLNFGTLTTPTVQAGGTTQTATMGAVQCNRSATATLTSASGALLGPAAGGSGTQNYINYTATTSGLPDAQASVNANVATGSVQTVAGSGAAQTTSFNAPAVDVDVTLSTTGANTPVQGAYTDTLTLEVLPQ